MLLHISPAGDDSNTGFSATKPLRTLNEFYRRVRNDYDLAGHSLFAQLSDGEYEENDITCVAATIGAVQVIVQGNHGDPYAVRVRCAGGKKLFYSRDLGMTTLRDLTLGTTGRGARLVNVTTFSTIDLDGVWFEAAEEGIHIFICQGFLVVQNDYRILGSAARHLSASDNGVAYYGGFTVEIPRPTCFEDFVVAEAGALITAGGVPMNFAGQGLANCTGRKFNVANNGVLLASGTEFPGDKPGIGNESAAEMMLAMEKRAVAERDLLLGQKDAILERQEALLATRDKMLLERDETIAEHKHLLVERDGMIAEHKRLLAERDEAMAGQKRLLAEQDAALLAIQGSRSWRLTAPLRRAINWLRR